MSFVWTDADGRQHVLTSFAPIVVAANAVADAMDRLIPAMEDADATVRDAARRALEPLQAKLERFEADLARWDAHADRQTEQAASELIARIDALPGTIAEVTLVVALHDEHDRLLAITSGAPETRAKMLSSHLTVAQRRAFMAIDIRAMPPETMTRSEGKALLDAEPRFARCDADTGGWFAWTDRHGHAHRLVDTLPIEREIVAVAGELAGFREALGNHDQQDALFTTVEAASTRWQRLLILEGELERFGREDEARDLDECRLYAAHWRSKRKI